MRKIKAAGDLWGQGMLRGLLNADSLSQLGKAFDKLSFLGKRRNAHTMLRGLCANALNLSRVAQALAAIASWTVCRMATVHEATKPWLG